MCVGQPGARAEGIAPVDVVSGPEAEVLAAGLVEALAAGLGGFPEGPERAEECGKRRRVLASKLWELQGTLQEIAAVAEGAGTRPSLAPLLRKTHGCCIGLQQAADVLKVQETAQLDETEAERASKAWASLEAALSDCSGQVQRLAAAQARVAGQVQPEARCGCLAGLGQLWGRKAAAAAKREAPAPSPPAAAPGEEEKAKGDVSDMWSSLACTLAQKDSSASRVLCSDSYLAEALLAGKCNGVAPTVTCIIEDPTQAQRLSAAVGAVAVGAILPGSPRSTVQHLAAQGQAFDAVVLEEPLLAELPSALIAPGGRTIPQGSLSAADLGKVCAA